MTPSSLFIAQNEPNPLWHGIVTSPFTWGLFLGLLIAFFIWKSSLSAKGHLKRELRRLKEEISDLQKHLNTQLKVNATGTEYLQEQVEKLKAQNETLRINYATDQQKPGKQEIRHLQLVEQAVSIMRQQAPGFASAWEQALQQAQAEQDEAESGLRKLVRKVIPNLGHRPSKAKESPIIEAESTEKEP